MPSRREFIHAGLAASVVPVAFPLRETASVRTPTGSVAQSELSLYCLVCDMRSRHGAAFADEAERLGHKVVRTDGDITDFWFADLALRWKESPVAIAGLTGEGALFCLERFGWDHGLRVVFRGTHRFHVTSRAEHTVEGPPPTVAAAQVELTRADWPPHLVRVLRSCAVTRDAATATISCAVPNDRSTETDDILVSWVIAPKHV
jgi:hypothetical protein